MTLLINKNKKKPYLIAWLLKEYKNEYRVINNTDIDNLVIY